MGWSRRLTDDVGAYHRLMSDGTARERRSEPLYDTTASSPPSCRRGRATVCSEVEARYADRCLTGLGAARASSTRRDRLCAPPARAHRGPLSISNPIYSWPLRAGPRRRRGCRCRPPDGAYEEVVGPHDTSFAHRLSRPSAECRRGAAAHRRRSWPGYDGVHRAPDPAASLRARARAGQMRPLIAEDHKAACPCLWYVLAVRRFGDLYDTLIIGETMRATLKLASLRSGRCRLARRRAALHRIVNHINRHRRYGHVIALTTTKANAAWQVAPVSFPRNAAAAMMGDSGGHPRRSKAGAVSSHTTY
jgi:hypothetical protein